MTTPTRSGTIRVPNTQRYAIVLGNESAHVRCNLCHKGDDKGWIYMFQSMGLSQILDAVVRHEIDNH